MNGPNGQAAGRVRVLLVVEGLYDIRFLRRISATLHAGQPEVPNLANLEARQELIFVPIGGGDLAAWSHRLAGLGLPEFHLYDREAPPETAARQRAADRVNQRAGCRAALTGKRNLENYLHPAAIRQAHGIELSYGSQDDVADLAARVCYAARFASLPWDRLPARLRRRLRCRAKLWLNTYAAAAMTPDLLAQRDPDGEVAGWLRTIAELAGF